MISTMRERMDTKCGNSNDTAFRIRKLFLAWDKNNSGMVHYEDLRQVSVGGNAAQEMRGSIVKVNND